MCFFFFFFNANKFFFYSVSSLRHLSWNSTVPVVASYPGSFQDIFTSTEHTSPWLAANTPWKVRVLTLPYDKISNILAVLVIQDFTLMPEIGDTVTLNIGLQDS